MKKSFKLFLGLLLIGGFALSFTSCKDSENVRGYPNSPEDITLSKESKSAKALLRFLSFTSELDSLPDDWASNSFAIEPSIGIVNDASTPYVRYVPVTNKEEAITKYNSFAGKGLSENGTSSSWNIENAGSMTFKVLDQSDITATLDVNIKQQPHLTQIRFVPASALGTNAAIDEEPYYSFGDVVSMKEGKNTSYWICVRPCSQLDDKGKSHWLSFQLNDWDDKEKNNVDEGSLNFVKLTKSGYKEYYLPTKLGNPSGSREHLQNLFKLLMVLDSPEQHSELIRHGIGTNNTSELTLDNIVDIAYLWEQKKCWDKVLPKFVTRTTLQQEIFNNPNPYVNVFYYGYHSTPSVYIANLYGDNLDIESPNEDEDIDEVKWKRTKGVGVDLRDFAQYGMKTNPENAKDIEDIPKTGYIVRYKTGRQMIGKKFGVNDIDYQKSFTANSNTIQDVYVYKNAKKELKIDGISVIGDIITSNNKDEVCILNSSPDNPSCLGSYSFYISPWNQSVNNTSELYLQNKQIASYAYIHLLNALILHSPVYKSYREHKATDVLELTDYYKRGLNTMYDQLSECFDKGEEELLDIVEFKAIGKRPTDKEEIVITPSEFDILKKFTIKITYKDDRVQKGQFIEATLSYDIKTGKYNISKEYLSTKTKILSLKGYRDIFPTRLSCLDEGQKFTKITSSYRPEIKQASIDYIKNIGK